MDREAVLDSLATAAWGCRHALNRGIPWAAEKWAEAHGWWLLWEPSGVYLIPKGWRHRRSDNVTWQQDDPEGWIYAPYLGCPA